MLVQCPKVGQVVGEEPLEEEPEDEPQAASQHLDTRGDMSAMDYGQGPATSCNCK